MIMAGEAMRLGIMQPYFFPYIGYFSLIDYCDEFVDFLDDHDDEKSDIYSQAEEVITKIVPKIFYAINHKRIEIPEE